MVEAWGKSQGKGGKLLVLETLCQTQLPDSLAAAVLDAHHTEIKHDYLASLIKGEKGR